MNALTKIALGALATTALALFLHGPMKFGENCAAGAAAIAPTSTPAVDAGASGTIAAPVIPATAEVVQNCQAKVDAALTGKTINFATSGSAIAADSQPLIDAIATELKACAGTTIEVQGHTDRRGGDAANQTLSEARANAVRQALAAKGVPDSQMSAKGYGEAQPLDAADTAEAYAKNRRIQFKLGTTAAAPAAAGQ